MKMTNAWGLWFACYVPSFLGGTAFGAAICSFLRKKKKGYRSTDQSKR